MLKELFTLIKMLFDIDPLSMKVTTTNGITVIEGDPIADAEYNLCMARIYGSKNSVRKWKKILEDLRKIDNKPSK